MRKAIWRAACLALWLVIAAAVAAGVGADSRPASMPATAAVSRDAHGRIYRSATARREFMRATGYPHGRPGWVVDHVSPLKRGGLDEPSNMQWQTIEDAKAKDKWE